MSLLRSAYGMDVVVTKEANGNIFLDKRDDFLFDYFTVNENSNDPPLDEVTDIPANSLESLHKEATTANNNFAQQVLIKDSPVNEVKFEPNPFAQGNDHLPSVAYCYRVFDLGDNTNVCVRCEYDSFEDIEVKGVKKRRNILIKTLTEYDQKITGGWRMKLESQKAGCLATELKNNNCKIMKWVLQAHLAEISSIKIGWISRVNLKDPNLHSILAVTNHPVNELASELGVEWVHAWGLLKYILNQLQKLVEGSYIIIRDPSRKNIQIYKTLPNEFKPKK